MPLPAPADPGQPRSLAERQAELVAALVDGAPTPAGFDPGRVAATRNALLRKRAGEVAAVWPRTAAALAPQWTERFVAWASGRPPRGSLRDGFDFARELARTGELPELAATELADQEAGWVYDGVNAPRRRRWPALRRAAARLRQ